ncbi:MAG TPA: DUF5924 family protein [Candidatus Binatia bacterium]|nr:DUF5924 family protein [Candidatus Binatia bacterium]
MPDSQSTSEALIGPSKFSLTVWLGRHKDKLWWLHSAYALFLGIGIMWLGGRNYTFLRVTVFHVGFIWLSSLFLPKLLNHPHLSERWRLRLRLFINFFNKNLYQQVLFFVLPIYFASATLSSGNCIFVVLLGISAVLSTLDVVYDRHLSVRQSLTAIFFAFNLFALINVMLPVLWSVSNTWTTRISAVLAAIGFATLYNPFSQPRRLRVEFGVLAVTLLLVGVEFGRFFIPPAPLRVVSAQFGSEFQQESMRVAPELTVLEPGGTKQLYGLTAIKAPLGLSERVQHRWYKNGKLFWASPYYEVTGGRDQGFRLWTRVTMDSIEPGMTVRIDVETEGGQLIGRAGIETLRRKSDLPP